MTDKTAQGSPRRGARLRCWMQKSPADKLRSIVVKVHRAIVRVEDVIFEKWHRIDCGGYIDTTSLNTTHLASHLHAYPYEAIRCKYLNELIKEAKKTGIEFDNFIDLGAGKGKACFYAATKFDFKQLVGIEFSAELINVAHSNNDNFHAKNIRFIELDAALFSLPKGNNLVFLYNPFGEVILNKFLEKNIAHFRENQSVIAYANDNHRLCMSKLGFATIFRSQDSRASLYRYC